MLTSSNQSSPPVAFSLGLLVAHLAAHARSAGFSRRPRATRSRFRAPHALLCGAIVASCFVTLEALAADKSAAKRFAVDARGSLELQVPTGWSAIVRKRADYSIIEIVFGAARGVSFEVSLTPSWDAKSTDASVRERAMRESVGRLIDAVKSHAVESELRVVKLDGANGAGLYFSATDKAPRTIDYKFLTQGAMQVGDLAISFTILTRDGQEQVVKDALAMLKSAKVRQGS